MKRASYMLAASALLPLTSHATNGYFTHGSSIESQGMAGVGQALVVDTVQAAYNPAALTGLDDQLDLGLNLFRPDRQASITGRGSFSGNGDSQFLIPQFGIAKSVSDRTTLGLAVYANGGMNTSYDNSPFGAAAPSGVDLSQLFVTGSLGFKLTDTQSVGVGVTHVYQRFSAEGIQGFSGMSSAPTFVSNNGYDHSHGWGLRLGWQGEMTDWLSLGASWSSRVEMDKFNKYRGLFAEQGGFDIPESYGLGFAVNLSPRWTLAGDWERINYGSVASIANPLSFAAPLGSDQGAGFGWQDIDVYKLGVIFEKSDQLTLRAGISHSDQPIPNSQTFFNILAPGVVQDHLSMGGTWRFSDNHEVTVSFTHALNEKVKGNGSIPAGFGGGEADIEMSQNILGVNWAYKW